MLHYKGFSILAILIAILVFGVAIAGGIYVFEKKNESPKEPVISAKSQENNVQPKASTTTVTQKPTEKPRGEPVFIKTTIDSKDKINLLTFKSKFIGAYESRGALTISIDGESIGTIYENTFLRQEYFDGVPLQKEVYYMVYFKEKLPGKHMVEFRLDPLNRNVKSNIEIADVRAIYDQNPREADNAKGNSFYNNAESAARGYLVSFLNFSNDKIERISTNDAISSPSYCTLKKIQFFDKIAGESLNSKTGVVNYNEKEGIIELTATPKSPAYIGIRFRGAYPLNIGEMTYEFIGDGQRGVPGGFLTVIYEGQKIYGLDEAYALPTKTFIGEIWLPDQKSAGVLNFRLDAFGDKQAKIKIEEIGLGYWDYSNPFCRVYKDSISRGYEIIYKYNGKQYNFLVNDPK